MDREDTKRIIDFMNQFNAITHKLSNSVGYLSKALGAKTEDDMLRHISDFMDYIDPIGEDIADLSGMGVGIQLKRNSKVFHEFCKNNLQKIEAIKNAFVNELDLAIKLFSTGRTIQGKELLNKMCTANSRFLSLYTSLVAELRF